VPQRIWLSEHKTLVFGAAAATLVIAGGALALGRRLPYPSDPQLAHTCMRLRRVNAWLYAFALSAFATGGVFAFALPWFGDGT